VDLRILGTSSACSDIQIDLANRVFAAYNHLSLFNTATCSVFVIHPTTRSTNNMPDLSKQKVQKNFIDVKIERRGETIAIPENMNYATAVNWLVKRAEEEERIVVVSEKLQGFPLDCAYALQLAVKERYGFSELKVVPGGMFRPDEPPRFINIPIDNTGKTVEVFIGRFSVPKLDPESYLQTYPDGFDTMVISGRVKAKELPEVKELAKLARKMLKEHSLYRGKAVKLEWKTEVDWMGGESAGFDIPTFMEPKPANTRLIVNDDTLFQIQASIWVMIEKPEFCKANNVPLKRSILAEGPFGTGKSLLAAETAEKAQASGKWTFFYLEDVMHLKEAYAMAAMFGRSVVFSEDIDIAFSGGSHADTHQLLNQLDGVDTKGSEIMLILTTNYADKLDQSILRPGRLDDVIHFGPPDSITAQELVRHYAGSLLAKDADLTTVGEKLSGQIPAVIREAVDRAKLFALAESDTPDITLDEVALVRSATSMKAHLERLANQKPKEPVTALEQMFRIAGSYFAYGLAQAQNDLPGTAGVVKRNGVFEEAIRQIATK
jgi:transitional endoplasmic reticulum ATPase